MSTAKPETVSLEDGAGRTAADTAGVDSISTKTLLDVCGNRPTQQAVHGFNIGKAELFACGRSSIHIFASKGADFRIVKAIKIQGELA
jgi:hypothetical protein